MSEQEMIGGAAAEADLQVVEGGAGASSATGMDAEISSEEELALALADDDDSGGGKGKTQETQAEAKAEAGAEAKAEAEAQRKAEAAAEEERLNAEAAEKHPAFQKRIDQLVKQRAQATEALEAQRQEAAALKAALEQERQQRGQLEQERLAGGAAAQGVSTLFLAASEQELDQRRDELMGLVQWCRQNPDGGTLGGQELEPEQVANTQAMAERELLVEMPAARKTLEQRGRATQFAATVYPEYFGEAAKGRGHGVMQGLLGKASGLARVEQLPVMVGDMLAGAALRRMGLRPDAKGETLLGKDGKPAWSVATAKDASARAIVAEALRDRSGRAASPEAGGGGGSLGASGTGAPVARGGGTADAEARFLKNPNEEDLARMLAG